MDGMKFNTEGLKCVNTEIKRLERLASDHEWEGNTSYAEDLYNLADYYRQLADQGELYVPNF